MTTRTYWCYIKGTDWKATGVRFSRSNKQQAIRDFAVAFGALESECDALFIGGKAHVEEEDANNEKV